MFEFIGLPKEYYEMRSRVTKRFEDHLLELLLYEREKKNK